MKSALLNVALKERLASLSQESIIFHPTPGNAGDSLIQAATYQIFDQLKINFSLFEKDSDVTGKILIIGGGGNFVPTYKSVRSVLSQTFEKARLIIILPQTIRGNEDLLEELGANVEIYCRDVPSYEHVLSRRSRARVVLAHDLAFSINTQALQAHHGAHAKSLIERKIPKGPHHQLAKEMTSRFFFRKDAEGTKRIKPKSNLDLSSLFKTGTGPGRAELGASALFTYLENIPEIHTDRLHVAITGSVLGRRVFLYDNSYGKNSSVYAHSLHEHFPSTQLIY